MAITDDKLATLAAAFDALPTEAQAILRNESSGEILRAFGQIVGDKRSTGIKQALTAAITGEVTINWTAIDTIRASGTADPDVSRQAYRAIKTALDNHNSTGLTIKAMAFCLSAISQYGE